MEGYFVWTGWFSICQTLHVTVNSKPLTSYTKEVMIFGCFFGDTLMHSVLIKRISPQCCSQKGVENNCNLFFLTSFFLFPWRQQLQKVEKIIKTTVQIYNHFGTTSVRNYSIESNILITSRYKWFSNIRELLEKYLATRTNMQQKALLWN